MIILLKMIFDEYVKKIDFRFQKPHQRLWGFYRLSHLLSIINISLEIINTKLPEEKREMKKNLSPLCSIPKMSTFAVGAIINRAVSFLPNDTCYVDVGVWNGFSLLAGMARNYKKKCIGVDNFTDPTRFGNPKSQFIQRFEKYKSSHHHFYEMNYVDYFPMVHTSPIGLYFYDGDHSYDNQLNGLKIAEPFFSQDCVILVDDTNRRQPRQATLDFIQSSSNNYQMLLDKTTSCNGNPTFWNGIMIFRRC